MKKLLVVVVVLAFAVPCLAQTTQPASPAPSQQEWPRKGDKIFVSATFEGVNKIRVGSRNADLPLPSCSELEIVDAKPDKLRWTAEWVHFRLKLEGPWLPRMHRTKEDCHALVSLGEGEPNVKRSGDTFTILPASPK